MNIVKQHILLNITLILVIALASCGDQDVINARKWEKVVLEFDGPEVSEQLDDNPFLNYRLMVTFSNGDRSMTVPGFYAADGNAAESSADSGNKWRVIFRPDRAGQWSYQAILRQGKDIAISEDRSAGKEVAIKGGSGTIAVTDNPNIEGRLVYSGKRYLQYAESGRYFLKSGCDSPENLLGYEDIDGTVRESAADREGESMADETLHKYEAHNKDYKEGDPSWKDGKGKGLIGGLNYLASKGVNAVYFLVMNIEGDGKDVYPYTSYDERLRFDCSKLDQWEIIFDHMDDLGIMLHVVLQETENELLLDGGDTGRERKLYYREMIARYAHHPRLTWNLGEENGPVHWRPEGQTTAQQKAMVDYIESHDPYDNFTVIHSHSDIPTQDKLFTPLLGLRGLDGMSMQVADRTKIHSVTKKWLDSSRLAGRQWVMHMDEIGPWWRGMDPDDRLNNNQDSVRAEALWGNLMAGGAGAEWYFGAKNHNNDLSCEDWRTRDRAWTFTDHAISFFERYIPFGEMEGKDELVSGATSYCFAKEGDLYVVYMLFGGQVQLDLTDVEGEFSIQWYDPRNGGDLQSGTIAHANGGGVVDLGRSPDAPAEDWAVVVKRK